MKRLLLIMVRSRVDRCIDPNDHGQSRGRVSLWEEAAGWPWSSPSRRVTTLPISGRPRARLRGGRWAATTSTLLRPGNRPADGGDREHKPSASARVRLCSAHRMRRSTSRSTRVPAPGSAGPRGRYATFADHLARLQAAEPHATAERLIELERQAAQATRQPAVYIDVTVSFSKSISVLHASLRENERRARLAADQEAAAYWTAREQAFQRSCTGPTGRRWSTCRTGPG